MSPSRILIFMHIPKTGGTTFCEILGRNFSRDETLTLDGDNHLAEVERFARAAESERTRYRLIQGHLHFGFHKLVPGESTYITFLREPSARALSFYAHARNHSGHYLHRRVIEERLDLRGLLEQNSTPELSNHQTRMIAGGPGDRTVAVDRATLETAKQNLRSKFSFVGLTEEFDAGLVLLGQMFGWPAPFYIKRNVTVERINPENLDRPTHGMLREANALDLELHQFARTLFEAKRREAGPSFEDRLRRFQHLNSIRALARGKSRRLSGLLTNFLKGRGNSQAVTPLKDGPVGPSL